MTALPGAGARGALQPAEDPADPAALNVLSARALRLCKVIRPGADSVPAQVPRTFDFHPVYVPDLAALADLLHRLALARECCIVRAAPLDMRRTRGVRRLLHPDPETGEAPTLRDVPRVVAAADLDGTPRPAGCDPRDLAACHAALRPHLPPGLRDAGCIVQATGSHAIKPGLRLRLWFVLDRLCLGADLAPWFAGVPGLDVTCFRAVQLTYTAAPIFAGGAVDPLPSRLLTIPGPVAVPPSLDAFRPPPRPAEEAWRADAPDRPDRVVARFSALLRTVAGAPHGRRHPTLFWASCRAGEMVAAGELGREEAISALAGAVADPGDARRHAANLTTARRGIARGMVEAR